MTPKADEVYQAGLELGEDERVAVAHRLLASLHPQGGGDEPGIDAAWQGEIAYRVDEILAGTVELTTYEQTRVKARTLLDDSTR